MKPPIPCSECGLVHDLPFSHRLLKLYQQFNSVETKEERLALTHEIATLFVEEHDLTDPVLGDEYHSFFEEYVTARAAMDRTTLKVSRLAIHVLKEYLEANEVDLETMTTVSDRTAN